MQKEIFVNVDPRETRVAVVEGGQLVELHMEREERVVGSIYKAKVSNVLPGMDAAFVDIGLEKNAFLYVGDILPSEDSLPPSGGDDKRRSPRRRTDPSAKIRDLVKIGQELLVQVVKAPRGTKGARVSTRVSMPGRYLVFMPDAGNIGISRKIEDPKERDRLKRIGDKIRTEGGIIIRTEAEGRTEADLHDDYDFLLRSWKQVADRAKSAPPATTIHQEFGLVFRVIRDMLSSEVYAVVIDDKTAYQKALELAKAISPRLADKVQPYEESAPIFDAFGIEKEVDRLLKPKVWMKSGGYLRIDETEALTSFDVNTGKFVGSTSLNETILRTNLEAVNEIVRQLRFRDLGGMIVLDFIDMASSQDRQTVMKALDTALRNDRTRTKVAHISPLGLIEMTRKRTGENLTEALRDACPYCEGRATIQSPITTAVGIDRSVRERAATEDTVAYIVQMHPDVAVEFIGDHGHPVDKLEAETKRAVYVRPDPAAHREKFAIAPADVPSMDKLMKGLKAGKALDLAVVAFGTGEDTRSIAWHNGILVDVTNGAAHIGQTLPAKLLKVGRSYMTAELVGVPPIANLEPVVTVAHPTDYPKTEVKSERDLQPVIPVEREFTTDSRGRDRHRRRDKRDGDKPETRESTEVTSTPIPVEVLGPEAVKPVAFKMRPPKMRPRTDEPTPVEAPPPPTRNAPPKSAPAEATPPQALPDVEAADKAERESGRRRRRRRGRKDDREYVAPADVAVPFRDFEELEHTLEITVGPDHPLVAVPIGAHDEDEDDEALAVTATAGRPRRRWQWRRNRRKGGGEGGSAEGGGSPE